MIRDYSLGFSSPFHVVRDPADYTFRLEDKRLGLGKKEPLPSILDQILDREHLGNLPLEVGDARILDPSDQLEHVPMILSTRTEL